MIYVCFILLASIRNFSPAVGLQSLVIVFINCGYQADVREDSSSVLPMMSSLWEYIEGVADERSESTGRLLGKREE